MTTITDFLSDMPKDFTPEMRAAAVEIVAQRALYLLDLALAQHDADYGKFKPTFSPTHWTHGARKIFTGVERSRPHPTANGRGEEMTDDDIARATTPMFRYGDSSGFEMAVRVTHVDGAEWTVGLRDVNTWIEFDAEKWPQIRNEIDRLLASFAVRADLAKGQSET